MGLGPNPTNSREYQYDLLAGEQDSHAILVKLRMFQTDIVVALQAFGSDCLTRALLAITVLGYSEFQIPLVIVLAFGVNLRKGLILVQILLVTSILTEYLKVWFALPRPADVGSCGQLLR